VKSLKGVFVTVRRGQIILILICIWILAIALPTVHFAPGSWDTIRNLGKGIHLSRETELLLQALAVSLILCAVILGVFIIFFLWKSRRKKKKDEMVIYVEPPRVTWHVYVIIGLLFLALGGLIWWSAHQPNLLDEVISQLSATKSSEKRIPVPTAPARSESSKFLEMFSLWWVVYLLILINLIATGWYVWRIRKDRQAKNKSASEVAEIAARAAADLERGGEISDVILRCYRDMCNVLSRHVLLSHEMTPREFAQHLGRAGVREKEVSLLTTLFERVRYGRHAATSDERVEAIGALKRIEEQYGRSKDEA
jgi:NADH:ubiquinone oxidoreductase subunit 5 (subunit L)/multisubunit Na+/H+ antiporter MnhA subunit